MTTKVSRSFRLTNQARQWLRLLARFYGCSQTAVIERLIREKRLDLKDLLH